MYAAKFHPRPNDLCRFTANPLYHDLTWTVTQVLSNDDLMIQSSRGRTFQVTQDIWQSDSGAPCFWIRPPIYSALPDGRLVQRLDTIEVTLENMLGVYVFHPLAQIGDDPIWTYAELQAWEVAHGYGDPDLQWTPLLDEGTIVETFIPEDGLDILRARFVSNPNTFGLHYSLDNLWVLA